MAFIVLTEKPIEMNNSFNLYNFKFPLFFNL